MASMSSQGEGSAFLSVTAPHWSEQFRIMLQRLSEAQVLFSKKANGHIEPELVHIPAGKFWMGSSDADPFAYRDEKPPHQLYLPEYWIGRYPVTVAEYSLFLLENPDHRKPHDWNQMLLKKIRHPITSISWHEALSYCDWLSGKVVHRTYTLPSEAEWEKAARGTEGYIYPWGNAWDPEIQEWRQNKKGVTMPVGYRRLKSDSPYGCVDMAGNVFEWTRSLYGFYPYDPYDGRETASVKPDSWCVLRGSICSPKDEAWQRCAFRLWDLPHSRNRHTGFRVAVPSSHENLRPFQQ